ncbi:hypothetical protein [uncultured Thermomonospora sp.]|uniref:hypothetical protein n=1 Tax=uncultured Thermomonospora sp. TaxID=671175 RepID=UPI00259B3288|nr:hypothetical protein [uncultured Thermomonospora sp.]
MTSDTAGAPVSGTQDHVLKKVQWMVHDRWWGVALGGAWTHAAEQAASVPLNEERD